MLVDTNVFSLFMKKDTSRAALYERHLQGRALYVSFITVGELYRWPFERAWGEEKKAELVQRLRSYTVLPFDDALAWVWAELYFNMKRMNKQMPWPDSWIAATALRHNMPLVTENRKDFEHVPNLNLISEQPKK